jgi:biofilm protein TabA
MILDKLEHAEKYYGQHPRFAKAFAFLKTSDLKNLTAGNHAIDGEHLFAIVAKESADPAKEPKLEAHRKYIDIQFTVDGAYDIGWLALGDCKSLHTPYNEPNDYMLYADPPEFKMTLQPNTFAIFFPDDAHEINPPKDFVKKIIVKIAVQ